MESLSSPEIAKGVGTKHGKDDQVVRLSGVA